MDSPSFSDAVPNSSSDRLFGGKCRFFLLYLTSTGKSIRVLILWIVLLGGYKNDKKNNSLGREGGIMVLCNGIGI